MDYFKDYPFRITYINYFGIMEEETFYALDEYCAKAACRRWAKNKNAPIYEIIKVEKLEQS